MTCTSSRWLAALVLACVAALALAIREVSNLRLTVLPGGDVSRGWFCGDPDSHYQMRRVERALTEGLPIAETDPALNFPHGSAIPWPPYYAYVLYALVAPGAPAEPAARREHIEHRVASIPTALAALAACAVALAAWRLARSALAGVVAGGVFALHGASLVSSVPGIGDHHAWVTLLLALILALVSLSCERAHLESPRRSALLGITAGAVAGVLVGSWVAGIVYVLAVEAALGIELLLAARAPKRGLAALGLAFHLAYAAFLAPAVLTSAWKESEPWMVVNLSWFHLAHAALGALVFAPLAAVGPGARVHRWWPMAVGLALAALGAAVAFGDFALARSVREGFAWAGRANEFMAFITESQPMLWGQAGGAGVLARLCGLGAFVLPLAWAALAAAAWRARGGEALVWAVAIPPLALQSLTQQRFADSLGVPMAVALGWCAAALAQRSSWTREARWSALPIGLALAVLLQWPTVWTAGRRLAIGERYARGPSAQDHRGYRELCAWLRERARQSGDACVLAPWTYGHAIEWVGGMPTVADNFGSYLGRDSYLDPWRFFLEEDPARAQELLRERRARYVLITADFTRDLEVALRLLRADDRQGFLTHGRQGEVRPSVRFFSTMAARLMLQGRVGDPRQGALVGDSLGYLRLVHVCPIPLGTRPPIPHADTPQPAGWIWELVPGAVVEARAAAGETLTVAFEIAYSEPAQRIAFTASAAADVDGIARVRVPYATDEPNGDGSAVGRAQWRVGWRSGVVAIPARAVESGAAVAVPD